MTLSIIGIVNDGHQLGESTECFSSSLSAAALPPSVDMQIETVALA
jgi:hypothetical protein